MAYVVQGVGDGALEEFFRGGVEGLWTGEIVIEFLECGKEAMDFVLPEQGLRIVPGGLALGHGERPIEEIAEVGEDMNGSARGLGGAEIGEGVWGAVNDFCAAIGDGGEAVTKEVTGTGVGGNHGE